RMGRPPNSFTNEFPSVLMPVPQSTMSSEPASERNSRQAVFPPYFKFSGCGVGVEPRTPQNLIRIFNPYKDQRRQVPLNPIPDSISFAKKKFNANEELPGAKGFSAI